LPNRAIGTGTMLMLKKIPSQLAEAVPAGHPPRADTDVAGGNMHRDQIPDCQGDHMKNLNIVPREELKCAGSDRVPHGRQKQSPTGSVASVVIMPGPKSAAMRTRWRALAYAGIAAALLLIQVGSANADPIQITLLSGTAGADGRVRFTFSYGTSGDPNYEALDLSVSEGQSASTIANNWASAINNSSTASSLDTATVTSETSAGPTYYILTITPKPGIADFTKVTPSYPIDPKLPGLTAKVVPEPGTLVLLGTGAVSLLGYGWRRRKAKA
jgi:hypothetical protein